MRGYVGLALIFAAFGVGIGCLQVVGWEEPRPDPTGAGGATGSHGSGGSSSSAAGGSCGPVCRNDLQAVVDSCTGHVMTTCTPDEGCANAACMPDPCKAAALSRSSYGCDYWALKTAQPLVDWGTCFAVTVANLWPKPVHLQVDRGGSMLNAATFAYIPDVSGKNVTYTPYDPAMGIPPGQVAILFLSRHAKGVALSDCPKPAALDLETGVDGTGTGTAFHIVSDSPVVAMQFNPYGSAVNAIASADLLLATSGWDKDYIAVSAYKASSAEADGLPSLDLVASQDQTDVTITPVADIKAGPNVGAATAGQPKTYTLIKGEFLQFTQSAELTGSAVTASKPIAVFGAHPDMAVPAMEPGGNNAQQQIAPIHGLGHEYVAVRYKNRTGQNEAPPWRIVGAAEGTALIWDPAPPPGAPQKLNAGQVAEFTSPGPFIVKSQDAAHPFYLGGYMIQGAPYMFTGAPQWVNVIPPAQYMTQYVFFTDPTFPETSLIVVRTPSKADGKTFADVNLECLGKPLDGWQPIGSYEYTRVDLVTGDFQSVNGCSNGRQVMSSSQPFGVTVWGWGTGNTGTGASYAYPAGASYQLASP